MPPPITMQNRSESVSCNSFQASASCPSALVYRSNARLVTGKLQFHPVDFLGPRPLLMVCLQHGEVGSGLQRRRDRSPHGARITARAEYAAATARKESEIPTAAQDKRAACIEGPRSQG